ncbi:pyridoxamine 5'-phosphate oxidase family protein [uncultured Eudoraea sp.]|uniref:pyridoxamine 5'-phosphate oxidase family protein n=1 Tax=uncultured Eudoraea sp. TaxID=1035614 RepID=UPI0026144A7A|nr:pyridoxamine 5'-phosphate oxidase family protein [uncultured Eudoraea sp.]
MGKRYESLNSGHIDFIANQKLFFVATAMKEGAINLSPKGMDSFRIVDNSEILWLNLTGSGNETATHLQHDKRMTIMFCAFEGKPIILRLYGEARAYHERDSFWKQHIGLFPEIPGSRQLIAMRIKLVQTSCGMGVPLMDYKEERNLLNKWAENKGAKGLIEYMGLKNINSLDGLPTGIFEDPA